MLTVAGAGPGNPDYLTGEVSRCIRESDRVIAFGRIAEDLKGLRNDILRVTQVAQLLPLLEGECDILLLATGDPGFFGIIEYLKRNAVVIDRVLPGISSVQYLMSKLKKSWDHCRFYSFHGREADYDGLRDQPFFAVLTDRENTPNRISEKLYETGLRGKLTIGFNLTYPDERIVEIKIGEKVSGDWIVATVVVEHEVD